MHANLSQRLCRSLRRKKEEARHARESLTTLVPLAAQQYLTDEDHDAVGTAHDLDEHGNVADRPAKINNESAMRAKCLSVQHQRDARLEWSQRVQQKQDDDAACKEQKVNDKLKDNVSYMHVKIEFLSLFFFFSKLGIVKKHQAGNGC